jgi:hypothetical protein
MSTTKISDSKKLIEYCKNNDYKSAKKLCNMYKNAKMTVAFSPSAYSCKALQHALRHKNDKLIYLLIEHPTFEVSYNGSYLSILKKLIKQKDLIYFKIIFSAKAFTKTNRRFTELLTYAARHNSIRIFKYITNENSYIDLYSSFTEACAYSSDDIVQFILNRKLSVNKISRYLYFLNYSDKPYYNKIKNILHNRLKLKFKATELPRDLYIKSVKNAIYNNDVEYYRELRQHKDFESHVKDGVILLYSSYSKTIQTVIKKNNVEILLEFLNDDMLSKRLDVNLILEELIKLNKIKFISAIFNIIEMNNYSFSNILKTAVTFNNKEIIDMILNDTHYTKVNSVSVILGYSLKNVELFNYLMNNEKIIKAISKMSYKKLPNTIKAYLIAKFDIKTNDELKQLIEFM